MATVTCQYCKKKFDRNKEPYIQIPHGTQFRYAHGNCYLEAVNTGKEKGNYTIWDPKTSTTCFWCHQAIYPGQADIIEMPQLKGRYVHKKCNEQHPADDKEELIVYLIKLYDLKDDYVLPKFSLQLSDFEKQYNFTYSGMLKSLKYWYEIKKNPVNKNYGLGIIPHIYKQAHDYYYALWMAQQQNKEKNINDYIPKDIEIIIPPPKRQITKRKLFTFLDEEELNGNE
jgi:hypothetical protein